MAIAGCQLIELPHEILIDIFENLKNRKEDVTSLSFTCKRLYVIGQQFILENITVNWQMIDLFYAQLVTRLSPLIVYIKTLSIEVPSSWGEWHRSGTLNKVLCTCTGLEELRLTLSGSSKWLQYLSPIERVSRLTLISNQANLSPALLDMSDLRSFKAIQQLTLEFFRLQCEYPFEGRDIPLLFTLNQLSIINCEWNYPFSMSLFRSLEALSVFYSIKCEAFTFSERLKNLALHPPITLKRFAIHLDLFSPLRQKSWYPILRECTKIEYVSLKGFRYPQPEFFELLPKSLKFIIIYMTSENWNSASTLSASHHLPTLVESNSISSIPIVPAVAVAAPSANSAPTSSLSLVIPPMSSNNLLRSQNVYSGAAHSAANVNITGDASFDELPFHSQPKLVDRIGQTNVIVIGDTSYGKVPNMGLVVDESFSELKRRL
ncbi:hypothetical protein V1511DRAFT_55469 [Dipodascopsis uninucleata]